MSDLVSVDVPTASVYLGSDVNPQTKNTTHSRTKAQFYTMDVGKKTSDFGSNCSTPIGSVLKGAVKMTQPVSTDYIDN